MSIPRRARDTASVYIPDHFRPADDDVAALLANIGAADLITTTADGLLATMLPLIHEPPGRAAPDAGANGRLMGHVARNNRQWTVPPIGEAMVIVRGPDAYISPAWYAAKREHGRVVPTWNYITAHIHGELVIHDDPAWVEANVRALSDRHEAARPTPWSVDDAPIPYIAGQLRAIVGVEILITRIEAKFKLSQNRSIDDVDGAIAGLGTEAGPSGQALAEAMRAASEGR
jgi:transcriptional regulator